MSATQSTSAAVADKAVASSNSTAELKTWADNNPVVKTALQTILTDAMTDRSLLGTKTFWITLITPLVVGFGAHFGLSVDPATSGYVAAGAVTVAAWVLRYITTGPVSGVLPGSGK